MYEMMLNKTILIFGGSGSWGRELTRQLLEKNPKKIIIFSRGEIMQVEMERSFNDDRIQYVIGDIRDEKAIDQVFNIGIDYVFQLAALKHVPICENQPREAIKTNIIGVQNVIDAAIKYKVKKFIDVSTDKAADPSNLYGMTKAIGERLTIQANCLTKDTDFICIRAGNVIGTNGSLIPYVIDQIKTHNSVEITDTRMTRFFILVKEAIELLFFAVDNGVGGETYIMNMPSFYIKDIISVLVKYYGNKKTKIRETGIREGEKLHESLISETERKRTHYINGNYHVVTPELKTGREYSNIEKPVKIGHLMSSDIDVSKIDDIKAILKKGGWLC